ncbi:N-acetylglucosamine kinase-like BadF-type ATPase [Pedobacter sp. UYEF25]
MILVADSGSSKTDWMGYDKGKTFEFSTIGINPYFLNEAGISMHISKNSDLLNCAPVVKEIYFFGAGCSSPDKHEVVSNGLSAVFKNAFISVDHDLLGSVYATCGNEEGLVSILGTGSNVCYFDGKKIHEGVHGLGYVLGDEGSGTFFGKKVLLGYLCKSMPKELRNTFREVYGAKKEEVITHVYQQPFPNIYLANFSRFMADNSSHPYIKEVLREGFQEFVDTNLKDYLNYQHNPCHFVGSIAHYYQESLKEVLDKNGIQIGKILHKPIEELFNFILKQEGMV